MWLYEHLETVIGGIFLAGVAWHFVRRLAERRSYEALRADYGFALAAAQGTAELEARVQFAECHRALMNSGRPGWLTGLGGQASRTLKVCLAVLLVALFLKGPIEQGHREEAARPAAPTARER